MPGLQINRVGAVCGNVLATVPLVCAANANAQAGSKWEQSWRDSLSLFNEATWGAGESKTQRGFSPICYFAINFVLCAGLNSDPSYP